jgi:hypothetical protein
MSFFGTIPVRLSTWRPTSSLPIRSSSMLVPVSAILSYGPVAYKQKCRAAFLNPSVQEFVCRRKVDNSEGGLILVIRRKGNEVICGAYHTLGFKKLWKLYVKFCISITGQWHKVYATLRPGEMLMTKIIAEWDIVEIDFSEAKDDSKPLDSSSRKLKLSLSKKRISTSENVEETNPKLMLHHNCLLARYSMWDWYRFAQLYGYQAAWEADGEESLVRLKRALVGSEDSEED